VINFKTITHYFIHVLSILLLTLFLITIFCCQSPSVNFSCKINLATCIEQNQNKLHFQLTDQHGTTFHIDFVENSRPQCLNPHFPAIHIQTEASHNAWIQIVYNDAKEFDSKPFIDAQTGENSTYPFYTHEKDFYDAPLWTYTLLKKPLTFWKAHAFPVQVDKFNKTIKCQGGIQWGFKLYLSQLRPVALKPTLLDETAWNQAWDLIKEKLPGYTITTN
jgi:hypothetical protein